jgi:glycosyltransferase involved in cell wall biosynthesis
MKARISKKQIHSKSGIVLSVGMIVKNEERYLERCLDALQPLLDAVPSELVIVDTGSTDSTVEIAGRFTDKVFHFEWINDFGAARNFGLDRCSGEWFMFLDADEILDEDISEMVDFFNDSTALIKYKSVTYMIRNYHSLEGSEWSTNAAFRIAKRLPGVRFEGAIHEGLSPFSLPTRGIKTFVHHWGYVHETAEQAEAKKQRNLVPLYEDLKKKPDDVRVRSHILSEESGDKFTELLAQTLPLARKEPNNQFSQGVFALNVTNYYALREYEKALGSAEDFLKFFKSKPKTMRWLDVYAAKALSLQGLERYDEAIETLDEYFKTYDAYLANRLAADMGNLVITFCEPAKHDELKAVYDNLLYKAGRKTISFDEGITTVQVVSNLTRPSEKTDEPEISEDEWKPVLDALRNNTYVEQTQNLSLILAEISQKVLDLPLLAIGYDESLINKNLPFGVMLYETAAKQAGRLPWDRRAVLYKNLVKYAAQYAADDYNPEDEIQRFGLYAGNGQFKEALDSVKSEHLRWAAEFLAEAGG